MVCREDAINNLLQVMIQAPKLLDRKVCNCLKKTIEVITYTYIKYTTSS